MKTGDVIYTKIANMGNKERPCIAICPEYVDLILENRHLPYLIGRQDA